MSMKLLADTISDLPFSIREQILGYADSVRASAKDIANEAGVEYSQEFSNNLAYLSGIKKLYSLVSTSFWSLDNTSVLLSKSDISTITIAGRNYSKNSPVYAEIYALLNALDKKLFDLKIKEVMQLPYSELAEWIANEPH